MLNQALLRKIWAIPGIVVVSTSLLWVSPSYAGNEIEIQALADIIPACDILGQTVGRLGEKIDGDGNTDGFSLPRVQSAPGGVGELAFVGLSCNLTGNSTMATITSPQQVSGGERLPILVGTTRMYAAADRVPAVGVNNSPQTLANSFRDALPIIAVSGDERIRTSDAVNILGLGSAYQETNATFAFGFEIISNIERIPAGQYAFSTILSVVPR
jgi:hypothetical protein